MLYRENGQFKTTYRADQQIFPITQDRIFILALLALAFALPASAAVGNGPTIDRDRRENVRDRAEDRRDHRENGRDRAEDRRDTREDVRDAAHDGGRRDRVEDRRDAHEDVRDHREDVRDRREGVRDRAENRRDRRH